MWKLVPMDSLEDRLRSIESQLAQLQRHVELQDSEMLEQGERVRRMERELKQARDRLATLGEPGQVANEKPPHY